MAKIKFKRTSTVGRKPTSLESGEIGINLADRKIYVGDDSGNIVQLGNDPITTERLEAKAGATITSGLTVSGNQSNTGNITVSGDVKSATLTTTGKATSGTAQTATLTATTAVNTVALTATGKTTLGDTKTGPLESTTLNATGVATVASLQTPGSISAGGNAVVTGKVNAGSVETVSVAASGDVSAATTTVTGKAKSGSVETGAMTASSLVATGDVKSATLTTTGKATSASLQTGAATATGVTTGTLNVTGASTLKAVSTANVTTTGDITASGKVKGATGEFNTTTSTTVNATNVTATAELKGATVTTTGKAKSGSVETGAITGSTITATGDVTTSGKVTANEIALTKFDNFDARYIRTGAGITNATKLETPRKIAGVAFDGSADISIPAANVGALPAAGGALTGAVTSNSNFTSTQTVQGQQVRATYRMGAYRTGGAASYELIRPDIITSDALPATAQSLGGLYFKEGSKTTDPHAGITRSLIQSYMPVDGTHRLQIDNRDNTSAVKNRIIMDSGTGVTRIDIGNFQAGTTTLGTTTTGNLSAGTLTTTGTITGAAGLTLNSPNAGIELGSLTTAGTPFIDFKVNGNNVDYDIRLIASPTSLSVSTPGTTLDAFNLTSTTAIKLHQTAASQIVTKNDATIIRDYGNGNVTLSAGRTSTTDTVGGDLYLGFTNSGNKCFTKSVRLEAPMTWKNTSQLVNASGKLVGASLDTEYLKLTGGTLSNNITIAKNGIGALTFKNTSIDTTVALPTSNQYTGLINFYEDRAGVEKIRSRLESQILTNGHTYTSLYVRDGADATKANIRLESETGLVNIATGNFRVGGTSTLNGATTINNTLTVNSNITAKAALWVTGALTADNLATTGDVSALNLIARSGGIDTNGDGNSHVWFKTLSGVEKAVIYTGADKVLSIRSNGRTFNLGEGGGGLKVADAVGGEERGLIRGTVDAGGHDQWRARSSGIQLDCPNANVSAYNVFKATKWGRAHFAGMDVHMAGNLETGTVVRLLSGNYSYNFYGTGELNIPGNLNTNDVYIRSDARLKNNIVKITSALDKIEQINGCIYDKKETLESEEYTSKEAGLIAQEIQEVLPEAVKENEHTKVLTISPSAVNALLVEAIKELTERVKQLEAK